MRGYEDDEPSEMLEKGKSEWVSFRVEWTKKVKMIG
jgi:hypothetical protein